MSRAVPFPTILTQISPAFIAFAVTRSPSALHHFRVACSFAPGRTGPFKHALPVVDSSKGERYADHSLQQFHRRPRSGSKKPRASHLQTANNRHKIGRASCRETTDV